MSLTTNFTGTFVSPQVNDEVDDGPSYYWLEGHDGFYQVCLTVAFISAVLSMLGSLGIIWIVLCKASRGEFSLYHRLLTGLSVSDFITTLSLALTPFGLPAWSEWPVAVGNQTTCNVVGFMIQYYVGVSMYNCALSFYYLLTIVYGWSETRVQKLLEPAVHGICLLWPAIYGTVCILTDTINPTDLAGTCEYGTYPAGCLAAENNLECERGHYTVALSWGFVAVLKISALCGIYNTVRVYWYVRQQTRRSLRSSMTGATERRIQAVATQACLYTASFLMSFTWATAIRLTTQLLDWDYRNGDNLFLCIVFFLCYLFFPLQGFFNMYIFMRPRVVRYQEQHAGVSWMTAFGCVFWEETTGKRCEPSARWTQQEQRPGSNNKKVIFQAGVENMTEAISSKPSKPSETPEQPSNKSNDQVAQSSVLEPVVDSPFAYRDDNECSSSA